MADRACLPGEMYLDAIVIDPLRALRQMIAAGEAGQNNWAQPMQPDDRVVNAAQQREPYVALRWVLNTTLGIPLEPFTLWRRPASLREKAEPIAGWRQLGADTFWWDGLTEMLRIELDVSSAVTVYGLSRVDHEPVTNLSGGPGTIVIQGAPMLGVRVSNPGAVLAARGLSVVRAANGDGWKPIERVGLPLTPELSGRSYYSGDKQGPLDALTDPFTAAVDRLKLWGPVLGWSPLLGLPPWRAPDPSQLVTEFTADLVPDLIEIMAANPPPDLSKQRAAQRPPKPLSELRQAFSIRKHDLNGPGDNQRSEIITRPLQGVAMGVASDAWASLTLGFGTGAAIGDRQRGNALDDFMVTAPWQGMIEVAVPNPFPWPWGAPAPEMVGQEVWRELAAVVLSPQLRSAPDVPTPVIAAPTYPEGAASIDTAYLSATKIETPRPAVRPMLPRPSAYGLARFTAAGTGDYRLREHPSAGGWIPIGSATPVRSPEQVPDPALTPHTVMLRDSGVARPITGADLNYQYAVAATDLFGQWSRWNTAWLGLGPAGVSAAAVSVARATAVAGPGDADPCTLTVTAEVIWDASERRASRLHLIIDVFEPYPAPPAALATPPDSPQPGLTAADVMIALDLDGLPIGVPAGVTVQGVHDDDRPVTAADPTDSDERRYRITFSGVPVTYGGASEMAVSVYCQAEERVRPAEWSGWAHAREMVIAPNPIPPPVPVPLPPQFPLWASLPNAAGMSFATVSWHPTGAWRYRVYEATEAALLATCGRPGPVLTDGYGVRMQRLFDLHKDIANLAALKGAYRKLGGEPVSPPVHPDGTMRLESLLPRGSSLIHCFVVVGVTETNVISGWPVPDAGGRHSFMPYAIPHPVRPPMPEIRATLDAGGTPQITADVGGASPVTTIRLYRSNNAVLARHTGTMDLIESIAPDPAHWQHVVLTDPGAPTGWDRLQYRVVAAGVDDLDRAGMAVDSPESKAYALLNPPPAAPDLILAEELSAASMTVAVLNVVTSAPARRKQIGDHTVSWLVRPPGAAPVRGSVVPPDLEGYPSVAAFVAAGKSAGYVSGVLRLRLDRSAGAGLGVSVDVTDPLGRTSHALLDIADFVPDPTPVINNLQVVRHTTLLDNAVHLSFELNLALPPNPLRDWTVLVRYRRSGMWFAPTTTRTFTVSSLQRIATPADMPPPLSVAKQWLAARVEGTAEILVWFHIGFAQIVTVTVTNSAGESVSEQRTTL